jgi:hypothetical protein
MAREQSLYQVLQVDPGAEPEIVEAAYRRLARMYHPDVSRSPDAERRMKEINAAHEVLGDPIRRADYDRRLLERAAPAPSVEVVRQPEPERPARERWVQDEDGGPAMLACRQHPRAAAVGSCGDCGAGLCSWCFERFQPASCPACILAWVSQRRAQLMLHPIWFFGVLLLLGYLFFNLDGSSTMPPVSLTEVATGQAVHGRERAGGPRGRRRPGARRRPLPDRQGAVGPAPARPAGGLGPLARLRRNDHQPRSWGDDAAGIGSAAARSERPPMGSCPTDLSFRLERRRTVPGREVRRPIALV